MRKFIILAATLLGCASSESGAPQYHAAARIKIGGVPSNFGGTGLGTPLQLSVVAFDSAGAVVPLPAPAYWASSNPAIASVDQTGTLLGLRVGAATIRVTVATASIVYSDSLLLLFGMAASR